MGFFDFLTGGKNGAARSNWRRRANGLDWDWDNAKAKAFTREFLQAAAPRFAPAQVKDVPDDEHIDLRGVFAGSPVRFAVWMSFGSFWSLEMKCPNGVAEFELERDHEKVPKHGDPNDVWEEQQERRIFVAKGIFMEGDREELDQRLAHWGQLAMAFRQYLVTEMERLDVRSVRAYANQVMVSQSPGLRDLDDPISYLEDISRLMAAMRDTLIPSALGAQETAAPNMQPHPGTVASRITHPVTCNYCSSLYVLTEHQNTCPNCGAPAQ